MSKNTVSLSAGTLKFNSEISTTKVYNCQHLRTTVIVNTKLLKIDKKIQQEIKKRC